LDRDPIRPISAWKASTDGTLFYAHAPSEAEAHKHAFQKRGLPPSTLLRPPHLPVTAFLRSRAALSLATSEVFSNCAIALSTWRRSTAVGVSSVKKSGADAGIRIVFAKTRNCARNVVGGLLVLLANFASNS